MSSEIYPAWTGSPQMGWLTVGLGSDYTVLNSVYINNRTLYPTVPQILITFPPASGFPQSFACEIVNPLARGIRVAVPGFRNHSSATAGDPFWLFPGQRMFIKQMADAWYVEKGDRWLSRLPVRWYVDHSSGLLTNDGLSSGSPLPTIAEARDRQGRFVDAGQNGFSINVANNDFTENDVSFTLNELVGGHVGSVIGNVTTPGDCIWRCDAGRTVLTCRDWTGMQIDGFRMVGGSGSILMTSSQFGILDYGNIEFGTAAVHVLVDQGGSAGVMGGKSPTIVGDAVNHWRGFDNSLLKVTNCNYVVPTARAFTAFAKFSRGARLTIGNPVFSGAGAGSGSSGKKFELDDGASGIANGIVLPGAAAGTADAATFATWRA